MKVVESTAGKTFSEQVGVPNGQFTALVILCLRVLRLADKAWYVKQI
jgi:hypothetical protein